MSTTHSARYINAPRARVYATLLDPGAIATWKVPDGMTAVVHRFEPVEGGTLRISLTYHEATSKGKTSAHTDTYHGRFVTLIPNERIVEIDEFETADPALQGAMTITITLTDSGPGTQLTAVHEGLPPAVRPADNELGWSMALAKLAGLVEAK